MPDLYGPFDNSSWSQGQWYRWAPTWAPSGVVGSAAAATTASAGPLGLTQSGFSISLSLGRAWVYGAGYERTSTPWTGTIPANTSTNPRIDALVLRRDLAAKTVLPTILQGTPAASPVAPTRASDELGQWDLPLYSWVTPPNSSSLISGVSDQRVWVDTQGTNYAVASAGGGQILAYGSTTSTQTTNSDQSYARVLGGLNVTPTLMPGRLYEYELSGHTMSAPGSSGSLNVRVSAIAGATAPAVGAGTVIAASTVAFSATPIPQGPPAIGKFTVGTAGPYTISPFINFSANTFTGTFTKASNAPVITVLLRDAGPSVGIVGTTPLVVP